MSEHRPVLVLAGTVRVVVGIARCLERRGITVDVAQYRNSRERIASRAIRHVHLIPDFLKDPEKFGATLQALVESYSYDTLIPTTDESLLAILPFYDRLCRRLYPGCPEPQTVLAVLDKRLTLHAARECGILTPREYPFYSLKDLDKNRDAIDFPVIAKPADKQTELKFAVHRYDRFALLREAFLKDPSFGRNHLLQQYCPGFGAGVELLIWNDKVHAVFQHRRVKELPSTGGVSVLAEAQEPDPDLLRDAGALLRKLKWRGVAMVEFRYDPKTAKAVLMEVNGRYWGSLPLTLNAGVEFPYYEWQLAHGVPQVSCAAYTSGFRTLWRVGDMMRFVSVGSRWRSGEGSFSKVAAEGAALIADFFSATPDALWQWNDPRAATLEFRDRLLRPLIRAAAHKLIPAVIRREARVYRDHGFRIGWLHTRLVALRRPAPAVRDLPSLLRSAKEILFVCSGNIMRSPMAAQLARQTLAGRPSLCVKSAGLFASSGGPADPDAITAAREMHVQLEDHRSTLLNAEIAEPADVIFVMDYVNQAVLLTRFPQAGRKTFLLNACCSPDGAKRIPEIADPYGMGLDAVRKSYTEVRKAVEACAQLIGNVPE
ncbi:MAG TPA: ATP-grasp domain-containing protein [Bryobacteraceae bacterium]|nr:ATP-grasp domain-containing protein [Bryobacteraceae bacterium]